MEDSGWIVYMKYCNFAFQAYVISEHHKKHVAVEELESLLPGYKDALILDLAAGTGIVGQFVSNIVMHSSM